MKLLSYKTDSSTGLGVVVSETHFVPLDRLLPEMPRRMEDLLAIPGALETVAATDTAGAEAILLDSVEIEPVVTRPGVVWGAALTYATHVSESKNTKPAYPLFFIRTAISQCGHRQPMIKPAVSDLLDYEGELAVIIGKEGRHIPESAAMDYVAGYTCYNDGSVRDWQKQTVLIDVGKNFAATGGCGPWLVTRDELPDPYSSRLVTRVNQEVVQDEKISSLLFSIEYMISYLSHIAPLQPGDIILTGTPGGVGFRRTPQLFLKQGDEVSVSIDGIGTLVNPVVNEAA